MRIGTKGKRGDWDEAKGQRLLWQPVMVAFGTQGDTKGDIYIAEGHANESPNDVDSDDPTRTGSAPPASSISTIAANILVSGSETKSARANSIPHMAWRSIPGQAMSGSAIGSNTASWSIPANGKFLKTLQERNLVCALNFDSQNNPWMASGQDGQFLKLDRNGKVLGAVGNGMGIGPGQFIEASYWSFDSKGDIYAGDTSVARVTFIRAPH